jgi:hypothetical protein
MKIPPVRLTLGHTFVGTGSKECLSMKKRDVIAAVILECTEVHQIRDLERGKSFDQLLNSTL